MKEEVKEASDGTLEQGDFKIKKKPRKLANKKPTKTTKLDLSKKEEPKKEEDAIPVGETKEVPVGEPSGDSGKVDEPVRVNTTENEVKKEEVQKPQIEEITEIKVKDTEQPIGDRDVVKVTPLCVDTYTKLSSSHILDLSSW